MTATGRIEGVRRIAVLRANGIGDLVFVLPALRALRQTYPEADLTLLGAPWHEGFLRGRGVVDRVISVPPYHGVLNGDQDEAQQQAFFERMQAECFDIAIQAHGGGRNSNPFVNRLGARLTAGLRTPDAATLDRWVPYMLLQPEVMRYLEVVSLLGCAAADASPHLPLTEADLAEAASVLPEGGRPLVAINPGASDPRRRWPPERFAAVADALDRAGGHVVILGGAQDSGLAEAVRAGMSREPLVLTGRLSLNGLTGVLSRCKLLVSNDSGPLHLADALAVPTVGVFWGMNVITAAPMSRLRHRPLASWQVRCRLCDADLVREVCNHELSIVEEVPVEEVTFHALDLLQEALSAP